METRQVRLPSLFVILPVQIIVGVFLFMALLNGRRDLIILSGVILTMGVGAWVWSRLSPASVRCRAVVDRNRVFPGDAFTVEIDAVNGKILPIMLRMVLSSDMPFDPAEDREPVPKEGSLLWYQRVRFRWGVTAGRRGVYRLGPSRVEVGDFFGFFPRPMMDSEGVEVVVYPRIVPLALPEFPRRDFFGVPGAASPVKDPVYLLGTRDYQPWTPARFIHWKASARHDRVQEKVFEPSEREKVLLAVDVDLFAAHGARRQFEETLEVAASTAFRLHRRGCAVGLVTNGAVAGGSGPINTDRRERSAFGPDPGAAGEASNGARRGPHRYHAPPPDDPLGGDMRSLLL